MPRPAASRVFAFTLLLSAATVTALPAQKPATAPSVPAPPSIVTGTIVGPDKKPIGEVDVLLGDTRHTATDRKGRFEFDPVEPGMYDVLIRHIGYVPVRFRVAVVAGDVFDGTITMYRTAQSLPEMMVLDSANALKNHRPRWMDGFVARRRAGLGTFLDRGDIERARAPSTARLIAEKAGIMTRESMGYVELRVSRCAGGVGTNNKGIIWVDGIKSEESTNGRFESLMDIPPEHLWGMEVYMGRGTIPPQYDDPAACLVVLLWTNRR